MVFQLFAKAPAARRVVNSWPNPGGSSNSVARGQPVPLNPLQTRAAAGRPMTGAPAPDGYALAQAAPQFNLAGYRGRVSETHGLISYNPIGAGRVAPFRPGAAQPTKPGNYQNGAIWWTAQDTPTSVRLTGLQTPQALAAMLGGNYVQAVVRTTG